MKEAHKKVGSGVAGLERILDVLPVERKPVHVSSFPAFTPHGMPSDV